ncbi:MAG TPA: response regulator, partial [Chromatiales bacterium]|nr:response regulator [Chromatiales bacterium]
TLVLPKSTNLSPVGFALFPAELSFILFDTHELAGLAVRHRLNHIAHTVVHCPSKQKLYDVVIDYEQGERKVIVILGFSSVDIDQRMHTRIIEKIKSLCDFPLMVLVSSSEKEVLDGVRGMGVASCLPKPVMEETLYRHLRSLVLQYFPGAISEGEITPVAHKPHAPRLNGLKVLVADDNEINRKLISELVGITGANVTIARNGVEVLKSLKYDTFDLFLIDLRMPEMDGFTTAKIIREIPLHAHTPIVALTADAAPHNRERAFEAGMNECLIKPIEEKTLWQILEAAKDGTFRGSLMQEMDAKKAQESHASASPLLSRDLEKAFKIAGNNEQLAEEIFAGFCEDLPLQMEEVKRLYERQDWEELSETAHRIRGSTRFCALPALDHALNLLEQASEKKKGDLVLECIEEVEYEVDRLLGSNPPKSTA